MVTETKTQVEKVTLALIPPIARLTLTNPPLNVIDIPMMDELLASLAQVESIAGISTLILSGNERAFSAGVDVKAHTPDKVNEMLTKFHAVIRAVAGSRKATVAAVQGRCLGGGAELAALCDIVFTANDAIWGFPEITLGCFPPVAAVALSAMVGQKRAADLLLTGRTISGEEAARIGLANQAAPAADLPKLVDEAIARLSKLSPSSLATTKKALYSWDAIHFDKGLARAEKIYLEELMKTEDAHEGIQAFMEKRQPVWKGK